MGDLRARMHAAVGAAGAGHGDRFTGDGGERLLEDILDRAAAGLRLPAEKAAAVVLQSYRNSRNMRVTAP
jgi:hypothetical protein